MAVLEYVERVERLRRIIESHVRRDRRPRLLALLNKRKRYADLMDQLLHDPRYWDPAASELLEGPDRDRPGVLARLRAMGANGTAYLAGDCGEFEDGAIERLGTLIEACVGSQTDSLVYHFAAQAGYYEGHEGFGYLLKPRTTG